VIAVIVWVLLKVPMVSVPDEAVTPVVEELYVMASPFSPGPVAVAVMVTLTPSWTATKAVAGPALMASINPAIVVIDAPAGRASVRR
jgi:hypothetical protein